MNDITLFGIGLPLLVAEFGIIVTTVSAAVGIWIERDQTKPIKKPIVLSLFVLFAGGLTMYQCWANDEDKAELEGNLAKILEQLDTVAIKSDVELPDLNETLKSELMIQGRANPAVLMDFAKRIAAKGGNPLEVLATYLPEADLQQMKRDGKFDEALKIAEAVNANNAQATKRPILAFAHKDPFVRENAAEEPDAGLHGTGMPGADTSDAGAPDASALDAGAPDADVPDASVAADAVVNAVANTGSAPPIAAAIAERESLKRQIDEARRVLATAKTWPEKRDAQRNLFDLLGKLDKLEKAVPELTAGPAATPPTKVKKPKIEIEEDGTP